MANTAKKFNGELSLNFDNYIVCNTFDNTDKGIRVEVKKCKDGFFTETFTNGIKTNEKVYFCELILLDKLNSLMN